MMTVLATLYFGLYIAIATVIVRKYIRTRDSGFIWLGAAAIVWPVVTALVGVFRQVIVDYLARQYGSTYATNLIIICSAGRELISVALLLMAVLYFHRTSIRPALSN